MCDTILIVVNLNNRITCTVLLVSYVTTQHTITCVFPYLYVPRGGAQQVYRKDVPREYQRRFMCSITVYVLVYIMLRIRGTLSVIHSPKIP